MWITWTAIVGIGTTTIKQTTVQFTIKLWTTQGPNHGFLFFF
jgi:hypothetical protein